MFDTQATHPLDVGECRRARNALNAYFERISRLCTASGGGTPSAVFEVSTSSNPEYIQHVLDGSTGERSSCTGWWRTFLLTVAREVLKLTIYWSVGLAWRIRYGAEARSAMRSAAAVQIGFLALADGVPVAQDFRGFTETVLRDRHVVVFGRRLPQLAFGRYFRTCRPPFLPLEAYFDWSALLRGLQNGWRLCLAARRDPAIRDTVVNGRLLADLIAGHMISGYLAAAAITRLLNRHVAGAVPACLPMERHDWELLATDRLIRDGRPVWAVQNCTFSPLDLNMYCGISHAPRYRNALPTRLFTLSPSWIPVFEELRIDSSAEALSRHRFSDQAFHPKLLPRTERIVYLGSINSRKVQRDLNALAAVSRRVPVEIRLHPSQSTLAEARNFPRQSSFDQPYSLCVYADTTMVFQLDTDRTRLVFLDHPGFPNQDPARFFSDWPGRTVHWANDASGTEQLLQLARAEVRS